MRIDTRIRDDEPAAVALRALPQRERAVAIRLMLRRHFGELPGLIGFRDHSPPTTEQTGELAAMTPPPAESPGHSMFHKVLAQAKAAQRAASAVALAVAGACMVTFVPHPAHAASLGSQSEYASWRLDANLASVHTERWARDSLNQRNPGLGVTWQASRTWALAAGAYTNSYRKPTVYALAEFTPLHIGQVNHWHVDAGVAAGIATGYTRAEIPCAPLAGAALIRVTAPDGIALNVLGVPNMGARNSGFIGFQLSVPLSRQ